MIRPLRDRILVEPLDEPLSTIIEVIQHKDPGKHSRGRVLAVGPLVKFDEAYRPRTDSDTRVGDMIHFTDLFKFPVIVDQGQRRLLLQEADVCFVEEREEAAA
jgi:co-chaperonin GroES (HSP10)